MASLSKSAPRRRPLRFLIRHYVGGVLVRLGDWIEGDYRYEVLGGPDFDGRYDSRPVPASWVPEWGPDHPSYDEMGQ